jgi:hypothetical protein
LREQHGTVKRLFKCIRHYKITRLRITRLQDYKITDYKITNYGLQDYGLQDYKLRDYAAIFALDFSDILGTFVMLRVSGKASHFSKAETAEDYEF